MLANCGVINVYELSSAWAMFCLSSDQAKTLRRSVEAAAAGEGLAEGDLVGVLEVSADG